MGLHSCLGVHERRGGAPPAACASWWARVSCTPCCWLRAWEGRGRPLPAHAGEPLACVRLELRPSVGYVRQANGWCPAHQPPHPTASPLPQEEAEEAKAAAEAAAAAAVAAAAPAPAPMTIPEVEEVAPEPQEAPEPIAVEAPVAGAAAAGKVAAAAAALLAAALLAL